MIYFFLLVVSPDLRLRQIVPDITVNVNNHINFYSVAQQVSTETHIHRPVVDTNTADENNEDDDDSDDDDDDDDDVDDDDEKTITNDESVDEDSSFRTPPTSSDECDTKE